MKKNILSLAALLIASATAFTACSSSDDSIISENQQPAQTTGKYTMTIQASKGDGASTRALTLDGNTLNATWDANEAVLVYQGGSQIGTLYSAASATSATTLTGTLDSAPDAGQALTLYFHTNATPSYTGQDGTLATIASTYDFCAPATIATGNFSVSGNTVSTTSSVSFGANQQAIVKFTLIDKADGTTPLSASQLVINDGTTDYTITPASATSEIYAAIPGFTGKTVTLTATVGKDIYTYEKIGVSFTNSQFYEITVKMTKQAPAATLLSTIASDYTAQDGETLTGTLANNVKISIADGATVTLKNVNITNLGNNCDWAGINCPDDATLVLEGTNEVCAGRDGGGYNNYPGIWIASNKTLTIQGAGTLTAYSNGTNPFGAGIGGGYDISCGNIVINSGNITATGGNDAAGIGGGTGSCGNITISGGTVTATGGDSGAGIGSGGYASCGNITISGGTVSATGGDCAAGIGGGNNNGACGTITITSGVNSVTATKGEWAPNSIGCGDNGSEITVTIEAGANVTQN